MPCSQWASHRGGGWEGGAGATPGRAAGSAGRRVTFPKPPHLANLHRLEPMRTCPVNFRDGILLLPIMRPRIRKCLRSHRPRHRQGCRRRRTLLGSRRKMTPTVEAAFLINRIKTRLQRMALKPGWARHTRMSPCPPSRTGFGTHRS